MDSINSQRTGTFSKTHIHIKWSGKQLCVSTRKMTVTSRTASYFLWVAHNSAFKITSVDRTHGKAPLFITSTVQTTHKCLHLFHLTSALCLTLVDAAPQNKMYHVKNFHPKQVSQNISPLRVLSRDCTSNGFIKDPE